MKRSAGRNDDAAVAAIENSEEQGKGFCIRQGEGEFGGIRLARYRAVYLLTDLVQITIFVLYLILCTVYS
jgi:hypothetical protein